MRRVGGPNRWPQGSMPVPIKDQAGRFMPVRNCPSPPIRISNHLSGDQGFRVAREMNQRMLSDGMRLPHAEADASPRLFRNRLLDRLSRVHPSVPFLIYLPAVTVLLWQGKLSLISVMVAFASGYLLWTLVEYFGHRLLF